MVKVCVVQSEPEWFDLQGSVKKAIALIDEAGRNGAELIAFPEVFIPGYPVFLWNNATDLPESINYIKNSLKVDSKEFQSICDAAKRNSIAVILGFSENERGSVYISQATITKSGEVPLIRRKFKSTHVERVLFGDATSDKIQSVIPLTFDEKEYNVGSLSCWEHAQPLLTYYGATQEEDIHIAAWPPLLPYKEGSGSLFSFAKEGIHNLCSTYAIQNSCYVLAATGLISQKLFDKMGDVPPIFDLGGGAARIFAPDGREFVKPLPEDEDGLLYAEINEEELDICRHFLHTTGHYSRPDMFSLDIHKTNTKPVNFRGESS